MGRRKVGDWVALRRPSGELVSARVERVGHWKYLVSWRRDRTDGRIAGWVRPGSLLEQGQELG